MGRSNFGQAERPTTLTKQGFRTKDEAQAWAAKNTLAINSGTWVHEARGKITIGELGQRWLSMQTHLKPSTYRTTESAWRVHVKPYWGEWQISKIKPSDVQHWVSSSQSGASTVRKAHDCLRQILAMAVLDGDLPTNPASGLKLPKKPKSAKTYLTIEQLQQLADEATKHKELIWLLGTVGLRWGEASALRVRDVNVLRRRINIEHNAVTVGKEIIIGTPKTHEKRTVAVPKYVMAMIAPLLENKNPESLLWERAVGGPLPNPSFPDWYYGAVSRCMEKYEGFPYVTPHGLRHVAAGLMVSSGASVKVVQRQLGHASAAMTLDVYADLFDGDLDEVADSMDVKIRDAV
ncbi:tyrosine-type recombinase/integrase [Corynebacterium sp. H113]|uniref:tyrosine-type recombinase/integrase n=1 Tax=Corynebacterium sp. H113 TaxID=3133419 RepID=UPI0030B0D6B3